MFSSLEVPLAVEAIGSIKSASLAGLNQQQMTDWLTDRPIKRDTRDSRHWRKCFFCLIATNCSLTVKSAAASDYLLHQLHDVLERVFFICWVLILPLKVPADLPHNLCLLLIALEVLWAEAGLVGFQPFGVLWGGGGVTLRSDNSEQNWRESLIASKTDANLRRDLFERRI